MTRNTLTAFALGLSALALAACDQMQVEEAQPGKTIFDSYCVACHGTGGQGDGRIAADLPVSPANLTLLSKNNGGVFPAEDVMMQVYGYPGRAHRGMMPEFGPVLDGPSVEWTSPSGQTLMTPQALLDLVLYLETLQQ